MRIAVLGMGAVGTTFAYRLTLFGKHEVTAIARNKRLEQLLRDGGHIIDANAPNQPVKIARVLPTLPVDDAFDVIVVAVLAHQLDAELLSTLASSKAVKIMFMFNTMESLSTYEDALGVSRFEIGFPMVQAFLSESGVLRHTIITFGGWPVSNTSLIPMFKQSGFPVRLEPRMQSWQRSHAAFAAPMLGMACIAAQRKDKVFLWSDAKLFAEALQEGCGLVRALGDDVIPAPVAFLSNAPLLVTIAVWLLGRRSFVIETASHGPREATALIDAMQVLATEHGNPSLSAMLRLRPE